MRILQLRARKKAECLGHTISYFEPSKYNKQIVSASCVHCQKKVIIYNGASLDRIFTGNAFTDKCTVAKKLDPCSSWSFFQRRMASNYLTTIYSFLCDYVDFGPVVNKPSYKVYYINNKFIDENENRLSWKEIKSLIKRLVSQANSCYQV